MTTKPSLLKGKPAVAVEFADNGPGISKEQQQRVFSSLLSTTKKKGTGLGLAIVSRIVEVHRAQLKIRSRPGKGTAISLIFPALASGEAAQKGETPAAAPSLSSVRITDTDSSNGMTGLS